MEKAAESDEKAQDEEVKLYKVYEKYDNVETEIKLLLKDDYINFLIRPFKVDSTKVTMFETASKVHHETVL